MQFQYSVDLVLAAIMLVGFWQVYAAMKRIEVRLFHFENTFLGSTEGHIFCKKHREIHWAEDECPKCREESRVKSIHRKKVHLEKMLEVDYVCMSQTCDYMGYEYVESERKDMPDFLKKRCPECQECTLQEIGEAERLRLKEKLNILGLFSSIYDASVEIDLEEKLEKKLHVDEEEDLDEGT